MTYRDDRDADQARITALEAELAGANKKIADLENHRSQALVLANPGSIAGRPAKTPWYGAPLRLQLSRTFEREFPRDELENLVDPIRAVTGDQGRTELFKSSLTWSSSTNERATGPFFVIAIVIKDGRTTLTATDRLNQLAGGVIGGLGGGLGLGGAFIPVMALISMPVLIPFALAGWLGGVGFGARALFKRYARKRAEELQRVFDAIAVQIETVLERPPA